MAQDPQYKIIKNIIERSRTGVPGNNYTEFQ